MPQRSVAGGVDWISALPDAVLQHVLGFLPAHEAVRTSVVASRWRHLWSSLGRLRVVRPDRWSDRARAPDFCRFVDRVLLDRDPACTLDEVEFEGGLIIHKETHISAWIRHALLCQASVLSVCQYNLDGIALVSLNLTKLELVSVYLDSDLLDFSSCPGLRYISITRSYLKTEKIISQTVERLCIKECLIRSAARARVRISIPSLIWLQLDCSGSKAPLLESTPSLQTAFVKYSRFIADCCNNGQCGECCGVCAICHGNDSRDGQCLLLKGVSSAEVLELIARRGMPIFNRDLRWCPTFGKLKTLLLNEWCVVIDLNALVCILKHSRILEKLTLKLAKEPKSTVESEISFDATEQLPAISEYLTRIEIKCGEVDGRVSKVIRLLSKFGKRLASHRISHLQHDSVSSKCNNLVQFADLLPTDDLTLQSEVCYYLMISKYNFDNRYTSSLEPTMVTCSSHLVGPGCEFVLCCSCNLLYAWLSTQQRVHLFCSIIRLALELFLAKIYMPSRASVPCPTMICSALTMLLRGTNCCSKLYWNIVTVFVSAFSASERG